MREEEEEEEEIKPRSRGLDASILIWNFGIVMDYMEL